MTPRWIGSAFVLAAICTQLNAQSRDAIVAAVQHAGPFVPSGPPRVYDSTVVNGLDPADSSSLGIYGFKGATVQEWTASGTRLRSVLYEMIDSPAAYGIFSLKRSHGAGAPTPVLIGAESFERESHLYFWQSKYFVQIDGTVLLGTQLAQEISKSILGRSRRPPVSDYLPSENRVQGSDTYILTPDAIEPSTGVDPAQLGFEDSAEVASANYVINGVMAKLLLVLYPTQHVAKKYEEAMTPAPATFRKRAGPLLAVVHGTSDEGAATAILNDISHEFKVTWNEPNPDLPIGTLIITIFTFTAVAIFFTVLAGVGFGGLRVWVKNRFPDRVFDRPEAMELIQLKLIQGLTDHQLQERQAQKRLE